MDNNNSPTLLQTPDNIIEDKEKIIQKSDPLTLELDDTDIVKTINKWSEDYTKFYKEKYDLFERRKTNEMFLFGKQIVEKEKNKQLKIYETRYLDNALYEIEASIKPLAMSRLPDLIVTPGNESKESKTTAENVGKIVDNDIKKRQNRLVLGIAFKHLPVYFVGVIKVRWDKEKDDYIFEVIHPDNIEVDHTCATNNADDMRYISHTLPITVQECFIRFPAKKQELIEQLRRDGVVVGKDAEPSTKELATQIKIREVWFDWYLKDKEDEEKYTILPLVMWKYKDVVLKKMKNPNYDYEGQQKWFTYAEEGDDSKKREIIPEDVSLSLMTGIMPPNVTQETVYRNYFDMPRKPFFFMGYDQWRKQPYDETSRLEQNLKNQSAIDDAGKRIIDKLKKRIKHILSKESGLKGDDLENIDFDDDDQDLLVDGDVNKVHGVVPPEQVNPAEFKFLDEQRQRMYSLAGANAIRGEVQSDTATTSQIAREADFTRADDLVEDTVNNACEWMAQWSLHMIKLRYTDEHFRKLLGAKGSVTFIKLKNDMIEDGMEVLIKASGTDKLKTQKQAMEMAKMQLIDPLTLFEDLGMSDPVGRTEKLMNFTTNPALYMAQYVKKLGSNTTELADTLLSQNMQPDTNPAGVAPTQEPVPQVQSAQPTPQVPTPQDTTQVPTEPQAVPQGSTRLL